MSEIEAGNGGANREQFSSKLDFLVTALTAAVGLGNVWRFVLKILI